MENKSFSENFKKFSEEKELSQREIAKKIGVSEVRMSRIIHNETPLRPIEVLNLLLLFDCKPTELFGNMFEGCFDE